MSEYRTSSRPLSAEGDREDENRSLSKSVPNRQNILNTKYSANSEERNEQGHAVSRVLVAWAVTCRVHVTCSVVLLVFDFVLFIRRPHKQIRSLAQPTVV